MSEEIRDITTTRPDFVEKESTAKSFSDYLKTVAVTFFVAVLLKMFVIEAFRIPSGSMENTLQVGDFLLVNKLAYGLRAPRTLPVVKLAVPSFNIPLFTRVKRGDVVVFEFPGQFDSAGESDQMNYVKRCIGLPGDTVEIRNSLVFVNGRELRFPSNVKLGDNDGAFSWHRRVRLIPGGKGYTENDYGPVVVPKRGDVIRLVRETLDDWKSLIRREGHQVYEQPDGTILIDGKRTDRYVVEDNYYFVLGDNRHNSLDSRFWGFVPDRALIGEALVVYWSWDPDVPLLNLWQKLSTIRWERIGTLVR